MNNQKENSPDNSVIDLDRLFTETLSALSATSDDPEKMTLITNFFQQTEELPEDLTYSFHLQLAGLFFGLASSFQPEGMPPDELRTYLKITCWLYKKFKDWITPEQFRESLSNILFYLGLNHFYLGEIEDGWQALRLRQKIARAQSTESIHNELEKFPAEPLPEFQEIKSSLPSNLMIFQEFARKFAHQPELSLDLDLIREKWKKYQGRSADALFCVLIERKGLLQSGERARLLILEAHCRLTGLADGHNLIRFSNLPVHFQEKTYLLASDAVEAVDYLMKNKLRLSTPPCSLLFSFSDKNFQYSGESFALPLALLALTQKLLASENRFHYLYSREVAFTGRVSLNGEILRISPEALEKKIKAAFYSGLSYLVIPAENLKEASQFLFKLKAVHPYRKFELIGISHLNEIITDSRICQKLVAPALTHFFRTRKRLIRRVVAVSAVVGALAGATTILHKNPSYHFWKVRHPLKIEVHNSKLYAYNPENQLLWIFPLDRPLRAETLEYKFVDLDGDGQEEILVAGDHLTEEKLSSELFCLEADGNLRWKFQPGRKIRTLTDEFSNYYIIKRFVVEAFAAGNPEKSILVIANHAMWYPAQIVLIDSRGQIQGEYWHAGHLGKNSLLLLDLDEDGRKEIIIGGTNNDFQQACLLVLDPEKIRGCSPGSNNPEFTFRDMPEGTQEYYLLFPRTTLNQVMGIRNRVETAEIYHEDKIIEITTTEFLKDLPRVMMYDFNYQLMPLLSRPNDALIEIAKEFVVSRVLPPHALTELRSLKDKIKYWDGEGWVAYPARNKKLDL